MSEEQPTTPDRTILGKLLRPKVALPLTGLILLLLSPVLIRGWNLSQIPDVDEPARTATIDSSSSNAALAHYKSAVAKFSGPLYPLNPSWLSFDPETGVAYLREADAKRQHYLTRGLHHSLLPKVWGEAGKPSVLKREEIENHLAKNTAAITEFYAATSSKFMLTDEVSEFFSNEDSVALDSICSLIILQAELDLEEQKLDVCWAKLNCVYRFWQLTTSYQLRYFGSNTYFDQNLLIDRIDHLISSPLMTSELFRQMTADLESARTLIPGVDWRINYSYEMSRRMILDLHKVVGSSRELHESGSVAEVGSAIATKSGMQLYMRGEPELSLRVLKHHYLWLRHWFDNGGQFAGEISEFPYLSDPVAVAPSTEWMPAAEVRNAFDTRALYLQEIEFVFPDWGIMHDLEVSRHDLLAMYVARKWYAHDHRQEAKTTNELVPEYLRSLPADPFDPNGASLDFSPQDWRFHDVEIPLFSGWMNYYARKWHRYWPIQTTMGIF